MADSLDICQPLFAESHIPEILPRLGVPDLILNSHHGSIKDLSSAWSSAEGSLLTPQLPVVSAKPATGFAECLPLLPTSVPFPSPCFDLKGILISIQHAQQLSICFLGSLTCDCPLCIVCSHLVWEEPGVGEVECEGAGLGVMGEGGQACTRLDLE